jgi:RNA polymerase sigma factor (TIGR02999 family)
MTDVTQLLQAIDRGEAQRVDELLPLVYDELRAMARQKLRNERHGHTLDATALVHEAYLRLVRSEDPHGFGGRGHFFAAAAEAMRRILVDSARRRLRVKRGGARQRVELSDSVATLPRNDADLLALDEALERLAAVDPRKAQLVKLRYFAGLTGEEAARSLGVGISTADRDWAYAKAWLFREMGSEPPEAPLTDG